MGTVLVVGLHLGDIHGVRDPLVLRWAMVHRLLGVAAAITVVLVDSIVVTYFIGTSRWCKEVVDVYGLDRDLVERSVKLKRSNFPWSVCSMLAVILVGVLGAAADPSSLREGTQYWVNAHLIGAFLGLIFVAISFYIQAQKISAHHVIIEEIVAQVRRIRSERGLEV
jgi:hypothetical protein